MDCSHNGGGGVINTLRSRGGGGYKPNMVKRGGRLAEHIPMLNTYGNIFRDSLHHNMIG